MTGFAALGETGALVAGTDTEKRNSLLPQFGGSHENQHPNTAMSTAGENAGSSGRRSLIAACCICAGAAFFNPSAPFADEPVLLADGGLLAPLKPAEFDATDVANLAQAGIHTIRDFVAAEPQVIGRILELDPRSARALQHEIAVQTRGAAPAGSEREEYR